VSVPPDGSGTTNPFSASRVRPGAIPFHFSDQQSLDSLIERLESHHWWGQIVGPHGSGKSTLMASLRQTLADAGHGLVIVELHDRQRRLPVDWEQVRPAKSGKNVVVIVDGFEQLTRINRWRLKRHCRHKGQGLVVSTHQSVGLPTLYETQTSLETFACLVRSLMQDHPQLITAADVAECFSAGQDNMREMLFDLYDRYEQRRRNPR